MPANLRPSGAQRKNGARTADTHVWSKPYAGHGVAADGSKALLVTGGLNGVYDFGGGPLTSAGDTDVFVAKFIDP